jgi:hypothetical protein
LSGARLEVAGILGELGEEDGGDLGVAEDAGAGLELGEGSVELGELLEEFLGKGAKTSSDLGEGGDPIGEGMGLCGEVGPVADEAKHAEEVGREVEILLALDFIDGKGALDEVNAAAEGGTESEAPDELIKGTDVGDGGIGDEGLCFIVGLGRGG